MEKTKTRLPPLDSIRGFVAVGRRMSVSLAAEDLFVTQSAVSRKVRRLEDALGCQLLLRHARKVTLTPEGEHLFRVADASIRQLEEAVNYLSRSRPRDAVTVTASIGVCGLWLLPRIGEFQKRFPGIDVRVAAHNRIVDLRREGVDLAIRYAAAENAPPGAIRLFGESTVPVAHPTLDADRLDKETLGHLVLLEFDDPARPWLQWSEQLVSAGLGDIEPAGFTRFNQYDQVIHAAVARQGVALGRQALVQPMIDDGRLKVLEWDGPAMSSDHAYWLVQADDDPSPQVAAVRDWILGEAERNVG